MSRWLPIALLLLAGLPASASAESRMWIVGRGYGHGIGMSQEGARGYAEHGWGYAAILGHYYTGTAIGTLEGRRTVRVLLRASGPATFSGARGVGGVRLHPNAAYTASVHGDGRLLIRRGAREVAEGASPLRVTPGRRPMTLSGSAINGVTDGRYRGALELTATHGDVQVVNALALEQYVRGVVSAESPPSWPLDALEAQAVAARTYAVTSSHGGGFDQYADTRSQMYRGVAAETARTDAAIRATRRQLVTYEGRAVTTYFFSTSGGHTENVEFSFVGSDPKPWLKGVEDPYEAGAPREHWKLGPYTTAQLGAKLGDWVKGDFERVDVTQRGVSPRIVHADVIGSGGRTSVTGPQIKARLGLSDTWADFVEIGTTPAPSGPPSAAAAGLGSGVRASARPHRAVAGRIVPGHRGAKLLVQRRDRGAWRTVAATRLRAAGSYARVVRRAGSYRVLYRGAAGPAVRLR